LDGTENLGTGRLEWSATDPYLQGKTFDSEYVGLSGWFRKTADKDTLTDIFRLQNQDCESDIPFAGCKSPDISYVPSKGILRTCIGVGANDNSCVESAKLGLADYLITGEWFFFFSNICDGVILSCFAKARDTAVSCSKKLVTGTYTKFKTQDQSRIKVGVNYYGENLTGQVADFRYYHSACQTEKHIAEIKG
jgi:hypothetical protein